LRKRRDACGPRAKVGRTVARLVAAATAFATLAVAGSAPGGPVRPDLQEQAEPLFAP